MPQHVSNNELNINRYMIDIGGSFWISENCFRGIKSGYRYTRIPTVNLILHILFFPWKKRSWDIDSIFFLTIIISWEPFSRRSMTNPTRVHKLPYINHQWSDKKGKADTSKHSFTFSTISSINHPTHVPYASQLPFTSFINEALRLKLNDASIYKQEINLRRLNFCHLCEIYLDSLYT